MEKSLTRETAIQLHVKLDTYYEIFKKDLNPEINDGVKALLDKAHKELYPALFDQDIDLEKSFDKLKTEPGINFLGEVPTIGRYP